MKKLTLPLFLGALVVGFVIWALTGPGAGSVVEPTDPTVGRQLGSATDRLTDGGDPDSGTDLRRRAVAWPKITVTGRCIDAVTGLPLSGCQVDVTGVRRRFQRGMSGRPPVSQAPLAFTSDDGRFRVQLDLPERHHIRLTTSMAGRAHMAGYLTKRGKTVDAGDIRIPTGARLVARVVDESGVPQPRIRFHLKQAATGTRGQITPLTWHDEASNAAGILETDVLLASGAWGVVASDNVRLIEPAGHFEVPSRYPLLQTRFVVKLPDPQAMITGKLVDARDRPIANTAIHAENGSRFPVGLGTSDFAGNFRVRCRGEPGAPVRLAVPRAKGYEAFLSSDTIPWGSANVVVTLRHAGDLVVRVVESGTGEPIEEYCIVWSRMGELGAGGNVGGRSPMGFHDGGLTHFDAVPAGKIRVVVMPRSKVFAPNVPYEFQKVTGDVEAQIELKRCVELPVQVVDKSGRPVGESRLELVRSTDGKPVMLTSSALDYSQYAQLTHDDSILHLLDSVVTDKRGSALLRWAPSADSLAIRVLGPGHLPMVHAPVVLGNRNMTARIVVSGGATLSGRVGPRSVLEQVLTQDSTLRVAPQPPMIILTYQGPGGPQGSNRTKSARVDENGRFRIVGLHPGKWDVVFRVWSFGTGRSSNLSHKKFDAIEFMGDEARSVDLNISDLRPSTLRGRVFVNGVQHSRGTIHLTRVVKTSKEPSLHGRAMILTTDDRGAFAADHIQPGRYRVSVDTRKPGVHIRSSRLVSSRPVDVPPGGEVERVFHVEIGKLRVRIVDSRGKPVSNQYAMVRSEESGFRMGARSDNDGWVEIESIAIGKYSIGVCSPARTGPGRLRPPTRDRMIKLDEVTVSAGGVPLELTLTMPDSDANEGKNPR